MLQPGLRLPRSRSGDAGGGVRRNRVDRAARGGTLIGDSLACGHDVEFRFREFVRIDDSAVVVLVAALEADDTDFVDRIGESMKNFAAAFAASILAVL